MKEALKYLGLVVILAGVIILSVLVFKEGHNNVTLGIGLGLVVLGFFGHILLNKFIN